MESFIIVKEEEVYGILSYLLEKGGTLLSFTPRKETIEDIYVSELKHSEALRKP